MKAKYGFKKFYVYFPGAEMGFVSPKGRESPKTVITNFRVWDELI
jgi:hypothetical protein